MTQLDSFRGWATERAEQARRREQATSSDMRPWWQGYRHGFSVFLGDVGPRLLAGALSSLPVEAAARFVDGYRQGYESADREYQRAAFMDRNAPPRPVGVGGSWR